MTLADPRARFAAAVADRLGLSIEPDRIAAAMDRAAARRGEPLATYLDRLERGEPDELGALASELTVGETYFLRHIEQCRAFIDVAVPDRLARGSVRALSVGCSSGEEPYTLAMLLREAHPTASFEVHGIDLNPDQIARARAGRYSRWSLRAVEPAFEKRWFQPDGANVRVVPEIKKSVTFAVGNALACNELALAARWDIVFCRNMMMYLTDENMSLLLARMARSLALGGFLFLGHAETLRGRSVPQLALCHTHGTFYYRRIEPTSDAVVEVRSPLGTAPPSDAAGPGGWFNDIHAAAQRVRAMVDDAIEPSAPPRRDATPIPRRPAPTPPPAIAVVPPSSTELDAIRDLLIQERFVEATERLERLGPAGGTNRDAVLLRALVLTHAGRFDDAREACRGLLALDGASAGANYLLALCAESTGDTDAAARLAQRSAELDPSFAMARVHLGLLARRSGDREIAWRELTRAIALLEREAPTRLALFGGGFSRQTLLGMCRAELAAIGALR